MAILGSLGALGCQKVTLGRQAAVVHFHRLLTAGRMQLDETMLSELLIELAECDVALHKSTQGRIELERFLLNVTEIGQRYAHAKAS